MFTSPSVRQLSDENWLRRMKVFVYYRDFIIPMLSVYDLFSCACSFVFVDIHLYRIRIVVTQDGE